MVLRRIFGSKRDELTGSWRELREKKLRTFSYNLHDVSVVKMAGQRGPRDQCMCLA